MLIWFEFAQIWRLGDAGDDNSQINVIVTFFSYKNV